jgi:lycopene cyclase domain-containing protein
VTFTLTALFLAIHWFKFKNKFLGRFYVTYVIHLIPFFLVNGILTYLPIVRYNDAENLGIRIFTIPIEDSIYSMLLLLMNISIYEYLMSRNRAGHKKDQKEISATPKPKTSYST